jgi:hypothetical protein
MHTNFRPYYTVDFSSEEYRLVTLALAGRLREKEDLAAAMELSVTMAQQRASHIGSMKEQADKSLQAAKQLQSEATTPTQT